MEKRIKNMITGIASVIILCTGAALSAAEVVVETAKEKFTAMIVGSTVDGIICERDGKRIVVRYADIVATSPVSKKRDVLVFKDRSYREGSIITYDNQNVILLADGTYFTYRRDLVQEILAPDAFSKEMDKSAVGALWRSLVFPGLGQMYTHDRFNVGVMFAGGFILTAFSALYCYYQANQYYAEYSNKKEIDNSLFDKHVQYMRYAQGLGIAAAGIYVWSAIDAYVNFQFRYDVDLKRGNLGVSATKRF